MIVRMIRRRVAIAAVVCASLIGGTAVGVTAQGTSAAGGWAPPQRLLVGAFREVSALIDPDGAYHIATVGDTGVWYVTDRSGAWRARRVLRHGTDREWADPVLAMDDDGRLHLALAENGCLEAIWPCLGPIFHLADRGRAAGTFSPPRAVTGKRAADPTMKVVEGRVHLAWTRYPLSDSIDQGDWFRVGYQVQKGDAWVRSRLGKGSHPQLRLGTDGRARIAYLGKLDERLLLARGRRRAGDFRVASVARARAGAFIRSPGLVLDWRERPLVVWSLDQGSGADRVFVSRPAAVGGWTRRSVGRSRGPAAISVDRKNRAHVALSDREGLQEMIVADSLRRRTIDALARNPWDIELRIAASGRSLAAWTLGRGARAGLWVADR